MSETQFQFARTAFLGVGSLLIWLAAFAFVYVFAALACAIGYADAMIVGLPIVPSVAAVTCIGAAASTVLLMRRGRAIARRATSESQRFIGFVASMTGLLSLVALVLLAMPALLVRACVP